MKLTEKEKAMRRIDAAVRRCKKCPLSKTRTNAVPGEGAGNAKILLVGEAPGKAEDEQGRPFVGLAGRILDDALEKAGLKRKEVFITSILKCRPPNNRNPKALEIKACHPYLKKQIETISPRVLVALGGYGLKGLTRKSSNVGDMRKKKLDFDGTPIVVTYHPAAVLYNRKLLKILAADLRKVRNLARK
ncbi:MAG: uracil-DNA glycosylase [Thermoplasmata archaeon]|nr:uracil-DNA glycosylase [Thermoplasmata archaeon]